MRMEFESNAVVAALFHRYFGPLQFLFALLFVASLANCVPAAAVDDVPLMATVCTFQ